MIEKNKHVDLKQYKEFIENNNAKMNALLTKFIWLCVLIGPAIAVGVVLNVFIYVSYFVCAMTTVLLLVVAVANSIIVKRGKNNFVSGIIIMCSLELIICIMFLNKIDIFMGFFLIPLVSLLYCDRRIYLIISGVCLAAMVACNWIMSEHYATYRIDMGKKTWFWSMTTGFILEYLLLFVIGYILNMIIIEHIERLCSAHINIASSRTRMEINESFNQALEETDLDSALRHICRSLGEMFESDRVVIYENKGGQGFYVNTYEWCAPGIRSIREVAPQVWRKDIQGYYSRLSINNAVYFDNVETLKAANKDLYAAMQARGVYSMVSALIAAGGKDYGFFSIENPKSKEIMELKEYCGQLTTQILSLIKVRDNFLENENRTMLNSMSSVSSIYAGVCLVDIASGHVTMIKNSDLIENWTQRTRGMGFTPNVNLIIQERVDEKYKEATFEFMDLTTLAERIEGKATIYYEIEGRDFGWCRIRFIRVTDVNDEDARLTKILFCLEFIDEEKKRENNLIYLSETDLMTGLRNRGSGEKKIAESISNPTPGLFCIIDVDDFKTINDNCGHAVGDRTLIAIGDALKKAFREQDVIMRLGGDEFAVYAEGIDSEEQAYLPINRLFNLVEGIDIPELRDKKIKVSVSMGAALKSPKEITSFDEIYKKADDCMYMSKRKKGCWVTFNSEK